MEIQNELSLIKPIGGSHDFCTYSLSSKQVTENSLIMSTSFPDDYGIGILSRRYILIVGGIYQPTGHLIDQVILIDSQTLDVTELPPLPCKMKGLRVIEYNDEAYTIGGCVETKEGELKLLGNCYKFSLNFRTWIDVASMPYPCVFPGCFRIDNFIWATGGLSKDSESTRVLDCIRIYDILTNTWRINEFPLLRPSYLHYCLLFPDRRVLIFGGLRDQNSNRFSYWLGSDKRKEMPLRISMGIIDPPLLYNNKVFAFNDEMNLLIYNLETETWDTQDPYLP
ncbi:unnamed protein product [Blepharisma stoltei]|uniref:Uncharacterized protein n=1 Tax=Blepharisma stoltei TaxID=1481888 RepID=A0AAU9IFU2_9CILI|nr:unnamed protein product [Blepharisma stoltei]